MNAVVRRAQIEVQLERINRLENPVASGAGIAAAVAYAAWQLYVNHWIATVTWLLPLLVVGSAVKLAFAYRIQKLEREKRELLTPGSTAQLPEARVVAMPAAEPTAPADTPSFLK